MYSYTLTKLIIFLLQNKPFTSTNLNEYKAFTYNRTKSDMTLNRRAFKFQTTKSLCSTVGLGLDYFSENKEETKKSKSPDKNNNMMIKSINYISKFDYDSRIYHSPRLNSKNPK